MRCYNLLLIDNNSFMFIKTFAKQEKKFGGLHTIDCTPNTMKKKGCFDLPHQEDLFTDEYWFHKINIIPHIENHRPSMKRRILRVKNEALSLNPRRKNKSELQQPTLSQAQTFAIISNQNKTRKNLHFQLKNKTEKQGQKYMTVKQSMVRQSSQVPDYARNLMRPCKIEAVHLSKRPATARKISTASSKPRNNRNGYQKNNRHKKTDEDISARPTISRLNLESSNKIQPWQQTEEDYLIY